MTLDRKLTFAVLLTIAALLLCDAFCLKRLHDIELAKLRKRAIAARVSR